MSSERVKIPTFFGIIWVVVVAVLLVQVERAAAIEESFCVGTGSGNDKANSFGWKPLRTMGWEAAYHQQRSLIWLLNHRQGPTWDSQYTHSFDLRPVKDPEGNILNGWVNLRVATKPENPEIFAMAAWVVDDDNTVIGSFVKAEEAVCRGEQTVTGQNLRILPCSATPKNSPANPGMFIFTKQENTEKITSVSLLWKMSVSMCDMPVNFFFKIAVSPVEWSELKPEDDPTAILDSQAYGPITLRTEALKPIFFGAASPVFRDPEGNSGIQLDCSADGVDWKKVKWLYDTQLYYFIKPFLKDRMWHWKWKWSGADETPTLEKDVMAYRATCRAAPEGHSLFGGRCEKPTGGFNYAVEDGLPGCDDSGYRAFKRNAATDINFQTAGTYQQYMESNRSDLRLYPNVAQVIQEIKHQDQRERALRRYRRHQEQLTTKRMKIRRHHAHRHLKRSQIDFWAQDRLLACRSEEYSRNDELGLCLSDPPGKYIYGLRQWHAGAALVCTMFFNPICTYVARYLKGVVFMNRAHRVPARMWYFFHVNMLMPMFCMFATGVPVLQRQRTIYGVSMTNAAFYHRLFGYIVSALPVIQIVTGILRPLEIHPWRMVMIYLHWFLGFLFKYGCLALCVTSYLIPGSPSAFISHLRTDEFSLIWKHPLPLIILASVAVDLMFHSILTLHIYLFDRRNHFRRYGYFPVLFAHVFDDEDRIVNNYQVTLLEYNHQKRVFRFYVFLCFFELLVIFNVMVLFTFTDDLHAVGPMTCTHDENGHFYIPPEVSHDEDLRILCPVDI